MRKNRFAELDQENPIIVYCGSGVTATPNYIALKMAGYKNVKLYAGSYSDWVSYEDNPVAKGKGSLSN
jgi:thiosulfate/3-mercaptopyruvate sulfurtransferase